MKEVIRRAYVARVNWSPGRSMLNVTLMDIEVFEKDGWKEGDEVVATIRLEKVEE